jgi:hypothetical protein
VSFRARAWPVLHLDHPDGNFNDTTVQYKFLVAQAIDTQVSVLVFDMVQPFVQIVHVFRLGVVLLA